MRHTILAIVGVLAVAGLADEASACSCRSLSTCALFRTADAVFVGDVIELNEQRTSKFDFSVTVQMRVVRAGKGVEAGQVVTLRGPSESSSCGMGFGVNRRWMVFAASDGGKLATSGCLGTYRLAVDEPLPDLSGRGGTVHGALMTEVPVSGHRDRGFAGAAVWIDTPGQRVEARTATDGRFVLSGVPPGEWTVRFDVGSGRRAETRIEMEPGDDCYGVVASVRSAGGLAGSVVDEAGDPVRAAPVVAVRAGGAVGGDPFGFTDHTAYTDERGEFALPAVPPGAYLLRIGHLGEVNGFFPYRPVFYPGAPEPATATVIAVSGEVVQLDPVVMRGALPTATIAVDIVCADGSRPAKAFATAEGIGQHRGREYASKTNGDGPRTVRVRLGSRYRIEGMVLAATTDVDGARVTEWLATTSVEVDPAQPPPAVQLRSDLQRCDASGGPVAPAPRAREQ